MAFGRYERAELDELHVREANAIADFISKDIDRSENGKGGPTTQVGKAAKVAENCASPLVFEQWLRYQAGRRVAPWDRKIGNQLMVDKVMEHQRKIAAYINKISGGGNPENLNQVLATETARFLGFLRRALIAHAVRG